MDKKDQFNWVPYYQELASKLMPYENKREDLVGKVYRIFEIAQMNMPTLEENNKLVDIDPFTFYGLFNKTSMTDDSRIKILNAIADIFSISANIPTSFDGIPVLNQLNATYYHFGDSKGSNDIDELWALFDSALIYEENPTSDNEEIVSKYFDLAINKKGNGNSKVTMGLYWIAPDTFLNLDSRNEWFIYESGKLPDEVVQSLPKVEPKIKAERYFAITKMMEQYLQSEGSAFKDFKELSFEAWKYSEEVNDLEKLQKKEKSEEAGDDSANEEVRTIHYWLYSPGSNANHWNEFYKDGIMAIGWEEVGDLSAFSSKSDITQKQKEVYDPDKNYTNSSYAMWQFVHDIKPGDIVYVKKGMHSIVGRGVVVSDYQYDDSRNYFKNVRQVKWTDKGEWDHPGQAVMKTLTDITPYTEYVDKLKALFVSDEEDDVEEQESPWQPYEEEDFLKDVYMSKDDYEELVYLLDTQKNVILQGAPGVGKTYAATKLAYSMMGMENTERLMIVQFHQSYSYEDFVMGLRPTENGYEWKKGVFYNFCKKAEADSDNAYFCIIDEINRGNLSKIFGELFMLIENDKRGKSIQLLNGEETFSIPKNIRIIGTMNTADRSLAMMDYALRRRFAFFDLKPAFDMDAFNKYIDDLGNDKLKSLIDCIKRLNDVIISDDTLGEGFCIGHSYFCNLKAKDITDRFLFSIVEYNLIPLLKEYWFDDQSMVDEWSNNLRRAIQ